MGVLDSIESEHRKLIKEHAKTDRAINIPRAAAIVFIVAPFAAVNFLFIPFAGQVLVLAAILFSVAYCVVRRSFKLFAAGVLSAAVSLVLTSMIASKFGGNAGLAAYSLMALGAAVLIAYNVAVIGAFWRLYENAAIALEEKNVSSR